MNSELTTTMCRSFLVFFILCALFSVPISTLQAQPEAEPGYLIVCGEANEDGVIEEPCEFKHLTLLVRRLINFLIFLSTILATAAFTWAGLILLTSGGNPSKKDEAKKIFTKVLIGYLWILGAWVLVYTITSTLLKEGYFFNS